MTMKRRTLALVSHFKWTHTDYLLALQQHTELTVAYSKEAHATSVVNAARWGIEAMPIGKLGVDARDKVRAALERVIAAADPEVIHLLYYFHEELVLMVRDIVGDRARIIFECRDPLTTLHEAQPGTPIWELEARAVATADGGIFVSQALRDYLEQAHDIDFEGRSLLVPHAFSRRNAGPLRPKLSATDGRTHIALVGTADELPGHGRYYGDIITRLVKAGLVVHSHFHEYAHMSLDPYRELAARLPDYHFHPAVPFRVEHRLSDLTSRYDLMGVFHELEAGAHNESATLAVCMPSKAVSGWLHGAIPTVCPPQYRGLVERIEEHGIGFVVDSLEQVADIAADQAALQAATARCVELRDSFTHEHQAARVVDFYEHILAQTPNPPTSPFCHAP